MLIFSAATTTGSFSMFFNIVAWRCMFSPSWAISFFYSITQKYLLKRLRLSYQLRISIAYNYSVFWATKYYQQGVHMLKHDVFRNILWQEPFLWVRFTFYDRCAKFNYIYISDYPSLHTYVKLLYHWSCKILMHKTT